MRSVTTLVACVVRTKTPDLLPLNARQGLHFSGSIAEERCWLGSVGTFPIRNLHLSSAELAGHSKWSNIRHGKAKKDHERSVIITKLGNKLPLAVRVGGGSVDPKLNKQVGRIVQQLAANNIPKTTIEKLLNNATKKNARPLHEVEFNVTGPSGSFFIIQGLTVNPKTAENSLKKYINKIGHFKMATGIRAHFEEKGIIRFGCKCDFPAESSSETSTAVNSSLSMEEAENLAIELNAEEVFRLNEENSDDISYQFVCDAKNLLNLQDALTVRGYQVFEADVELRPLVPVLLTPEENEIVSKLYEKLDSDEEINKIFDNLAT